MENKRETDQEIFAPYVDESEHMTSDEVEQFMKDWPHMREKLKKKDKEEE